MKHVLSSRMQVKISYINSLLQSSELNAFIELTLIQYLIFRRRMTDYSMPFNILYNYRTNGHKCEPSKLKKEHQVKVLWTFYQQFQFLSFFIENEDYIVSQQCRKKEKVFVQMAKLIKTKTSTQIKSHHQKFVKKHGNITRGIQMQWQIVKSKRIVPTSVDSEQESSISKELSMNSAVNIVALGSKRSIETQPIKQDQDQLFNVMYSYNSPSYQNYE